MIALEHKEVETLTPIRLLYTGELIDLTTVYDDQDVMHTEPQQLKGQVINTTVGRVIFNDSLPKGTPYVNGLLRKKGLQQLVQYCYLRFGLEKTVQMLDAIKDLGFSYATRAGISIGIDDLIIPEGKEKMVGGAQKEVIEVEKQYLDGAITNGERYNKVISIWSAVTEKVADAMFKEMERQDKEGIEFNPIYIMADSGARGSKQQIRQLAGMRGLMAKPSGEIIENPITSNFREGLTVLQYFVSTHGARKGLADTALKTADSGYLTRRLVDVSQDVIISEHDCGTVDGLEIRPIIESGEVIEPLRDRIIGRVSLENIKDPIDGSVIVKANEEIGEETANAIQAAGIEKVRIRSVLSCESARGVCALCYGRDLATGKLVEMGMAVGVIAAQSIGEPGTQLTMRTFHIGGTAQPHHAADDARGQERRPREVPQRDHRQGQEGRPGGDEPLGCADHPRPEGPREGAPRGRLRRPAQGQGRRRGEAGPAAGRVGPVLVHDHDRGQRAGRASRTCIDGQTVHEQVDENTGMSALVIIESPDEKKQPRIEVRDAKGKILRKYLLPSGAHLMVEDGQDISAGDVLAKIPRETAKTKDITGGLPRVVELFEARRPKEPAVITEIDGSVKYGDVQKQYRKIFVTGDDDETREYQLPRGAHINVQEGERVKAGEPLMDGPIDPHDILRVRGEKELQRYLVDEIQEVYRLQGVNINDKHIEVISRQMMRWVKVEEVGDSEFLIDEVVDRFRFMNENNRLVGGRQEAGQRPPAAARHHQGVALHRLVHLGGELPGDDARAHRGRDQRQGRPPARPEGERHHGPADPRRHGHGVLPEDQDPRRGHRGPGARAWKASTPPSTWSSPSTSARAWRRCSPIPVVYRGRGFVRGLEGPPASEESARVWPKVSLESVHRSRPAHPAGQEGPPASRRRRRPFV